MPERLAKMTRAVTQTADSKTLVAVRRTVKSKPRSRPRGPVEGQEGAHGSSSRGNSDSKRGNLFLIDDAWTRAQIGTLSSSSVSRASDARIDTVDRPRTNRGSVAARAWTVRSPITFQYRVVEAPGLLDPSNDALLFGHLEEQSIERAAAMRRPQRRLIVIDETVDSLYGERVRAYFDAHGTDYSVLRLPMVEEEKDIDLMLKVCEAMKTFDVDRRNEPVIAIGGGVCLDVVGLAATLFRRKTPYVRVPTTTLSYVDASVGAKTGVNFMGSKNRLGAYVPPAAALLDPAFITTESRRAVASGVAEMAKMAIMKSPELFLLLESNAERLVRDKFQARSEDDSVPARVLRLSIETMLEELAPNLTEQSLDRLVDFGHTIGQELEMHALGSEHELTHGESVAVDMAYSAVLACVCGHISPHERDRIIGLLAAAGLPLYSPVVDRNFIRHAITERVKQSNGQRLPLPTGIGKANLFNEVSFKEFYRAHDIWLRLVGPAADIGGRCTPDCPPASQQSDLGFGGDGGSLVFGL